MEMRKDMKRLLGLCFGHLPKSSNQPHERARQASSPLGKLGWALLIVLLAASLRTSGVQVEAAPVSEEIRSNGDSIIYMPMIGKGHFEEYWYEDEFSDLGSGWPWGSGSGFSYGYKEDADTSDVYHTRLTAENRYVFMTGPAYALPDFEFITYMRRATSEMPAWWGDEYGILVSPTQIDPTNPFGEDVYTFAIQIYVSGNKDPHYVVTRWDIQDMDNRTNTVLKDDLSGGKLVNTAKIWNRLRITRTGNKLKFYISTQEGGGYTAWGDHVYKITDDNLPDVLYIGFFSYHQDGNEGAIEFQYDNVWVHAWP